MEIRELAEVILQDQALLLRFAGIDSPEAASSLRGAEIIVERESAAPLKEGEYYVDDLVGLEVVEKSGLFRGRIASMAEGGGGELAEVILESGEMRFVPFRKEFFGDVCLEKGKIVLLEPWILEKPE